MKPASAWSGWPRCGSGPPICHSALARLRGSRDASRAASPGRTHSGRRGLPASRRVWPQRAHGRACACRCRQGPQRAGHAAGAPRAASCAEMPSAPHDPKSHPIAVPSRLPPSHASRPSGQGRVILLIISSPRFFRNGGVQKHMALRGFNDRWQPHCCAASRAPCRRSRLAGCACRRGSPVRARPHRD